MAGMSKPEVESGNRILIVDDEFAVREILSEGLTAFGFITRTASRAKEGLEIFLAGGIDLVLSDIDMPEMSGLEFLAELVRIKPDADVIMVTGVVDTDTAVKALRDGARDYVTKPFNLEEVRIVIRRALENRRLINENRSYQEGLEVKVEERTTELKELYESTLQAMATALDFRDNETQGHSIRVVEYALMVANSMGVEDPEIGWIRQGALLHDIGKIGVPDAILRKPGKLDADEWIEMRKHPEHGYQMLRHIRFLEPALEIVLSHQERYDGSGYPRGLAREQIPLGARIFAVVDCFDAMTSDRPYRAALPIETAREEVRTHAGTQFDPAVAEAFLSIPDHAWREIREKVHAQVKEMRQANRQALRPLPPES
jgi:putative nucleotidyltransferase with HDIG domain